MHQIRSSWANFVENTCKHIEQHDSKLNLRNQSPRVFNSNSISNQFFMNMKNMQHAWIQIISKLQFDALVSQLFQKQVENMDHCKIMNMHVPFHEGQLQNFKLKACMHELGSNSRLKSLRIQELGMNKLKHNNEKVKSLPRSSITRFRSSIGNYTSISFKFPNNAQG